MGTYKDYLEQLAPPWLQGPRGRRWTRSVGDGLDALVERLKLGVKARFPLEAPEDALGRLGLERGIPRGAVETSEAYAARLADAWETWPWAGTPYGMLRAFRAAGYSNVALETVGGKQFTLDANGELVADGLPAGSWAIDATPAFWSKFQVLFLSPLPANWSVSPVPVVAVAKGQDVTNPGPAVGGRPSLVDNGLLAGQEAIIRIRCVSAGHYNGAGAPIAQFIVSLNDGLTWFTNNGAGYPADAADSPLDNFVIPFAPSVLIDFAAGGGPWAVGDEFRWVVQHTSTPSANSAEADTIRALIAQWKPAHATCGGIVLRGSDGELWGYPHAGAAWGDGGTWGGSSAVLWPFP